MQATAEVETAADKGYHSKEGDIQKDGPSNPERGNVPSSSGCNEANVPFHGDGWGSLPLERRANDEEISNAGNVDLLELSFTAGSDSNRESTRCQSREFEDSIDYVFLNETYSILYSESKLKNQSLIPLNSELDSEIQRREEMFFDILEHKVNKIIDLDRIRISDDDCVDTAEDVEKPDTDEDSQQEYLSAEEQGYLSGQSSLDQAETLDVSSLEVAGLRNSGYEVKHADSLEVNHVKLESSSSISLDSIDVCGQEDSPHVSKFQNSVMLREYHKPKDEHCKEHETGLMYHRVFDEFVLRNNLPENQGSQSKSGFLNPEKALKTKIYTSKIKSQVTERKDFCGNATVENKMLQHLEDHSTSPQDEALERSLQRCKDSPYTSVCDASVVSASGHSLYKSLLSAPNSVLDFPVTLPRTGVKDNRAVEDSAPEVTDGSTAGKTCFHGRKGTCPRFETGAAQHAVTVNQAVDASADFRACFTASRATSTRPSVVCTSSNTEITMMNKKRPGELQRGRYRSVACNTDWPCSRDSGNTPMAGTEGSLGKSLSVGNLRPNGNFLNKDSLELRKTCDITDLKEHPEREPQLHKEMEKNLPSKCCQKTLQRAIKAELHLLNIHYQMCHRHCSDIYKLVMENREGLNRNLSTNSTKKELGSALLSVLGDLKVKYVSLKERVNQGIPLEELPPLSVESKLLSTFSTFASRLMKKESHVFSGADSELDNQSTRDVDVSSGLKKTLSQVSVLPDDSHPKQGTSPKEGGLKNGDIEGYFGQLKLDDKDYKNYQDVSEDWFDAKESLTGVDCSGVQENQLEQDGWDPKFTEIKNAEPSQRDKGYLVHVGSLCPSVSEADLRSCFQKYQVSEISIFDSSNYRYASLAFKRNSDAKSAAKEMNGIEINGKSVNVRLVKSPGECTTPLSSKNGRRISLSNLEKSTNKEVSSASSASRLPRTRPRQLVPEQDSECFRSDQEGVKKKNCKQIDSTKLFPDTTIQFIPPNTLNLRSFTKIMKRLAELHPDVSRDRILDALQEVRLSHKGFLNGLSINNIVEMTLSVLKTSDSS